MKKPTMPRYPVFIPTKGRADHCLTAMCFIDAKVPFKCVVNPNEAELYAKAVGADNILVLPENDKGLVFARNWIKDYSGKKGDHRHWQFDDDIDYFSRYHRGYRLRCPAGVALRVAEDFVDRYENVALLSFNSEFFIPCSKGTERISWPPFYLNHRCYTCFLVLNQLENRWRQRYNEDTDMTLQVLAAGWCTILLNAFLMKTETTMSTDGGNTTIYVNDGRLRMARSLERMWPRVVTVTRRFQRPQHKIAFEWKKFDTQLKPRKGVRRETKPNEYGMKLLQIDGRASKRLAGLVKKEVSK